MSTDSPSSPATGAEEAAGAAAGAALICRLRDVPGLDVEKGLSHLRGRSDSYVRLLRKFADTRSEDVETMDAHIAAHRYDELFPLAHNIKGVAGFLGAREIESLATDLCAALRSGSATAEANGIASALMRAQSDFAVRIAALATRGTDA